MNAKHITASWSFHVWWASSTRVAINLHSLDYLHLGHVFCVAPLLTLADFALSTSSYIITIRKHDEAWIYNRPPHMRL